MHNFPIQSFNSNKITSYYGRRIHPITKVESMHYGIDYPAEKGTKVYSVASGKVVVSKMQSNGKGFGNYVVILHTDSTYSLYAHLDTRAVNAGDIIGSGKCIGTVGSTGDSTGNHLHFGLCYNYNKTNANLSRWFDPLPKIKELEKSMTSKAKEIKVNSYGEVKTVHVLLDNGENYIRLRDIDEVLQLHKISYDGKLKMPVISKR